MKRRQMTERVREKLWACNISEHRRNKERESMMKSVSQIFLGTNKPASQRGTSASHLSVFLRTRLQM